MKMENILLLNFHHNNKYVDWVQEYIFMCDEDEKDFLQIGNILKITVGEE